MKNQEITRNVLVAVDVQNDFISGSLAVKDGEQVVPPLNDVSTAVRDSKGEVTFTKDWHPLTTRHFDNWPVHCVRNTEGAALHPDLAIEPSDIILPKGIGRLENGYSGWEGMSETGETLEKIITPKSSKEKVRVFIGGLATDYCVKATALDIARHYEDDERVHLYLLRDATKAVNLSAGDEAEALAAIEAAKVAAISSAQAKAMIEGTAL